MDSYNLKWMREQLYNNYLAEQKRQRDEFDEQLASLNKRIKEAEEAENQRIRNPDVLVRSSLGARRRIYHRADNPCGRTQYDGGKQAGFRKMPESEAKQLDGGALTRCTSCWRPY